jgi:hypothetical protein
MGDAPAPIPTRWRAASSPIMTSLVPTKSIGTSGKWRSMSSTGVVVSVSALGAGLPTTGGHQQHIDAARQKVWISCSSMSGPRQRRPAPAPALRPRVPGQAAGKFAEKGMDQIRHPQPDRPRPPARQSARQHVGLVIELAHPFEHAFAGFLADVGPATQNAGAVTVETPRSRAMFLSLTAIGNAFKRGLNLLPSLFTHFPNGVQTRDGPG